MAGPPGSAAGGEQAAQGLRGQGAAAGSRGPGDPQDRPAGGLRDCRGGPQRAGRHQPIPQRQGGLCLRGTGAGGTAERRAEVQGHEDHQGRLGTLAVGTGGGSLAAGRQKPEIGRPVLSVRHRSGKKRAIVAVARKLLCVLYAMLRTSTPYKIVTTQTTAPRTTGKESVRTSTPEQTTPTETTAARTTGKKLVRTSTPEQTTPTETTAARTTGKKLVRTSTPDQTTTTGATAPRTTRKRLLRTSTPDQTVTT